MMIRYVDPSLQVAMTPGRVKKYFVNIRIVSPFLTLGVDLAKMDQACFCTWSYIAVRVLQRIQQGCLRVVFSTAASSTTPFLTSRRRRASESIVFFPNLDVDSETMKTYCYCDQSIQQQHLAWTVILCVRAHVFS